MSWSTFLLDERQVSPKAKLGALGRLLRRLVDTINEWRSGPFFDHEAFEYGQEDWKIHQGRDRILRCTNYDILFVHLTKDFVAFYECCYNFLRDQIITESTHRNFYEEIVGVEKNDITETKMLKNIKVMKYQRLKILLRGSENIERIVPSVIFIKRSLFDRFLRGYREYGRLETEMDAMEKIVHALNIGSEASGIA